MNSAVFGPLCSFGSSVTWAIGSSVYSRLSTSHSAFSVNFLRALIALPLFILAAGITDFQSVRLSHWGWFSLSAICSYGIADVCFFWSTRSLGVPGAIAIGSCFPMWTLLAGYLFDHEAVSFFQVLGLVILSGGVSMVILSAPQQSQTPGRRSWPLNPKLLRGIFLAVVTSILWAANSYAVSKGGADVTASAGNAIRMVMALIFCTIFGRIFAPREPMLLPMAEVRKVWGLFALEAFGGSYLYVYGLSHSPLALGAALSSLAPVISVPVALAFGLERFSLYRTLGVTLVVLGVSLLTGYS